jgi:hypothetical protein
MPTVAWRADYAKFMFEVPSELWHSYAALLHTTSHECKYAGEWLKSHKVNRLWYDAGSGKETWSIEIWGEWTGIVHKLPPTWFHSLKRLDTRAIVWDTTGETIINIGQHLQKHVTSHNINVYSTKPASKRLGRDRGGKGFAIGSHKSDLRITTYKRTGEPAAQEFQMTGAYLQRLKASALRAVAGRFEVYDIWEQLIDLIALHGTQRIDRVLKAAGCDQFWSIIGSFSPPILPPTQHQFIPELDDNGNYTLLDYDLLPPEG